jgi:hypothetical protein
LECEAQRHDFGSETTDPLESHVLFAGINQAEDRGGQYVFSSSENQLAVDFTGKVTGKLGRPQQVHDSSLRFGYRDPLWWTA